MTRHLRYACWFALAAGLAEALLLVAHGRQIHGFIYLSPHLVWMAPVGNLIWFGLGTLFLAGLGLLFPGLRSTRAALALCLFLAALSILLIPSQLHRAAAVLIAAGVAYQASRFLDARLGRVDRITRRTLPVLLGIVLLLGLGLAGWSGMKERRALKGLPASRAGAPNVLLLVLDTVRRASMSLYGYDRATTPALERWARRGVRFDHAFATASWTLPSHASMFTGRFPSEMSAGWLTPLDAAHPVLAERFQAGGYATAGFVANILYGTRSFGLSRGFIHYEDYRVSPGELVVNNSIGRALSESHFLRRLTGYHDILGRKPGSAISDRFLRWQEDNGRRPWFAFLNYFDAHQPYLSPPDLAEQFGPVAGRDFGLLELRPYMGKIERAETALSPAQVTAERNAYDATLAYLDREVDRLLTALERRGVLENTIVIITSDHGEQFMEHGLFDHGNSLYRFATEVPLVMLGAGVPAGVVTDPVSLRDLPATIMDLTGVTGNPFPGASLRGFWAGNRARGPVIAETWGPGPRRKFQSVIDQGYHAIWSTESTELYAFDSDPNEIRNLAGTPDGEALLRGKRVLFDQIRPGEAMAP